MVGIFFLFILCLFLIEKSIIAASVLCVIIVLLFLYQNKTALDRFSLKSSLIILRYILEYILILCINIIASNVHVAMIVLSPKINIQPRMIAFKTHLRWDINKAILANSITLTPGTLTVQLYEDTLMIHCLDERFIDGLGNLSFDKILMKIEGVYNDSNN